MYKNPYDIETVQNPELKRNRIVNIIAMSIILVIAIAAGALFFMSDSSTDSGITACQEMKKNAESGKKSSGKMTDAQRKEKREPFENSQYPDIRVAGTNLVDSVYEMDQKKDSDNLGDALATLTTIRTQYAALQTACSAHGVDLPNLKA
jgi:hypothetical protein